MQINKFEELSLNAWPSLQTKLYDGWILRFAEGYTKRSNSVSPIYESTIDFNEKIEFCEKQYASYGLPAIFKLTSESKQKGIDEKLHERGYEKIDETSVRVLELNKTVLQKSESLNIETKFSDIWAEGLFKCSGILDKSIQSNHRKILDNIKGKVICTSKQVDGIIVGCGYGAIERDFIGIFDIVVDKDFRGNGFGEDIMRGILNEAYNMGVKTAYLSVVVGNMPAENLYSKLGFSEVYRYWYRKQER